LTALIYGKNSAKSASERTVKIDHYISKTYGQTFSGMLFWVTAS